MNRIISALRRLFRCRKKRTTHLIEYDPNGSGGWVYLGEVEDIDENL